jgi:pimeloyl-ACP methyl ester carboxylesterase
VREIADPAYERSGHARVTRRQLLQGAGAVFAHSVLVSGSARADEADKQASTDHRLPNVPKNGHVMYGQDTLPLGIRSRLIDNNNGLTMHILEAGFEAPQRPCVVLLHGFPELAYTWRHQLLPLARAGFYVMAPDLRGYGRTTAAPVSFDDDLLPYSLLNRVSDVLGLTRAVGYQKVACVVGHDWGGPTAEWCALVRPEVFRSVVTMSTPFSGAPTLPLGAAESSRAAVSRVDIEKELAALPRPRKHYWWYYASPGANADMWHAPQGVHDLLRAMYYFKSADWNGNRPFALKSWTASELARMPEYYIMDLAKGIAETMAMHMPSKQEIAACHWMTEEDLRIYSAEYTRTGFQGGLNSYRILTNARYSAELKSFSDRRIDVPSCFIGGAHDWAVRQSPGAFEAMKRDACTRLLGVHLIDGAGHSVPEEQPRQVNRLLLEFLQQVSLA